MESVVAEAALSFDIDAAHMSNCLSMCGVWPFVLTTVVLAYAMNSGSSEETVVPSARDIDGISALFRLCVQSTASGACTCSFYLL